MIPDSANNASEMMNPSQIEGFQKSGEQPPKECDTVEKLADWIARGGKLEKLPLKDLSADKLAKVAEMILPILDALENSGVKWVFQGSFAVALQAIGLEVEPGSAPTIRPNDIDFLVPRGSEKIINEALAPFLYRKMSPYTKEENEKSPYANIYLSDEIGHLAIRVLNSDGKYVWYEVGDVMTNLRMLFPHVKDVDGREVDDTRVIVVNDLDQDGNLKSELVPDVSPEKLIEKVVFGGKEYSAVAALISFLKHFLDKKKDSRGKEQMKKTAQLPQVVMSSPVVSKSSKPSENSSVNISSNQEDGNTNSG